jgi:hypothetical protein
MIYKILYTNPFEKTIFGRIDDDGLCRVTCIAENPEFQTHIKAGAELQDADGNVMTDASAYIASLP